MVSDRRAGAQQVDWADERFLTRTSGICSRQEKSPAPPGGLARGISQCRPIRAGAREGRLGSTQDGGLCSQASGKKALLQPAEPEGRGKRPLPWSPRPQTAASLPLAPIKGKRYHADGQTRF